MDDHSIRDAIAVIDREVPRDGARVKLHQYGGGPDEGQIIANQTGFLRLGVELLKAAYAPTSESSAVRVDIRYLLTEDCSIAFDWFERREPVEEPPPAGGRFAAFVFFGVFGSLFVLAIVGLFTVVRWLLV